MNRQYEEIIIKVKPAERRALQNIANKLGANIGDVIRGHITQLTQQKGYLDQLPEILRKTNMFMIERKMVEDEEKADIAKDGKKWKGHINKAFEDA
jgi:arsenate reductase-like glutaredoxin family protein